MIMTLEAADFFRGGGTDEVVAPYNLGWVLRRDSVPVFLYVVLKITF